jgi:hypothetical protein
MSVAPPPATEAANLFSAETTWFHVFKSMIESGDAARLGGTVFSSTASSRRIRTSSMEPPFPRLRRFARQAGLSESQVT